MNTQSFVGSASSEQEAIAQAIPSSVPVPQREGEELRHILLGKPSVVRQTIHLLHHLRYVETVRWSPLIDIPNNRLIITPRADEVMSLLVKHL